MALLGHVDSWSPILRGWVYDDSHPDRALQLSLLIDGRPVSKMAATDPRPDVAEAGHSSDFCGFEVLLNECIDDTSPHEISLIVSATGVEFARSPTRICANVSGPILMPEQRGLASLRETRGDLSTIEQRISCGSPLALVSAFRPPGCPVTTTANLVSGLSESGFVVVVVDTSDNLPDESHGASVWAMRDNVGHDFASWDAGIELVGTYFREAKEVLIVNDSCYGPFASLGPIIEKMRSLTSQVVSLTDGRFGGHHLQSNFLFLKEDVLRDGILTSFFETYDFPILKREIVKRGEIALSTFLRSSGVKIDTVFRYEELCERFIEKCENRTISAGGTPLSPIQVVESEWEERLLRDVLTGVPVNTTHAFWDVLLELGFPLVKRDLLTANPTRCPNLRKLPSLLETYFDYTNLEWIRNDLRFRGQASSIL